MLFAHIFSFILVFSFVKSAIVCIEASFSDTSHPLREQRRKRDADDEQQHERVAHIARRNRNYLYDVDVITVTT